jgi:TonB family protein
MIEVPGLLVRGGSQPLQPTLSASLTPTQRNLLAGIRAVPPPATRVSSAQDPRLEGRVVYTLAIEMPNITSYSGSWMVWFAEHESAPGVTGEMVAPLALRKVDPGYIPAAAEERVEGVVRLFGTIRKDGHVEGILLIRHLDDRLDRSAQQALAKWEFRPASRNGAPVEVDAVFEVPFRLEPRPRR